MNHRGFRRSALARYRPVAAYTGLIWALVALVLLSPLLLLPFRPEEAGQASALVIPAAALGLPGWVAWQRLRTLRAAPMSVADGAVVVVLAWVGAIAAATGAFLLLTDLTPLQALFEATSGLTTTGLSVVDVTKASGTVLLLRSNLELAGGAGLAILMVSLLGGPLGAGLSAAEGRGEQLVPNVVQSAKIVVRMYAVYAVAGSVALWAAGMGWFDAINHAFAAVSTGGFSTRVESIGYWDSPAVEAVTLVLMLLGTTNFLVAWSLARGRWSAVTGSGELRLMAALLPLAFGALLAFGGAYPAMGKAARVAVFETVSALSTTGFSTVGYGDWSVAGWLVLVLLMLIGGGSGSTAGGIKQARIYLLWRAARFEVTRVLLPRGAVNQPVLHAGGRPVHLDDAQVRTAGVFVFVYLCVFGAGVFAFVASGVALPDATFEMASTLSTVGLSVGVTSADAPVTVLLTQIVAMVLGRLEFFVVLVGLGRLATDNARLLRGAGSLR